MVGQRLRCRAAATLAAVDGEESGACRPRRFTSSASSFMNCQPPIAVLMPTGLPVMSRDARPCRAAIMLEMSRWRFGDSESCPAGCRGCVRFPRSPCRRARRPCPACACESDLEGAHRLVRAPPAASREPPLVVARRIWRCRSGRWGRSRPRGDRRAPSPVSIQQPLAAPRERHGGLRDGAVARKR